MRSRGPVRLIRIGAIILIAMAVIGGGAYVGMNYLGPEPTVQVNVPELPTSTPRATGTATTTATATAIPTEAIANAPAATPTATATSDTPGDGIIYNLPADSSGIGWVQSDQLANHFGESYLYTGARDGVVYNGAMQFDLTFVPEGSTIFLAELELTGLTDTEFLGDGEFVINLLDETVDANWTAQNFETLHNAPVVNVGTALTIDASELAQGKTNKLVLDAAQRSIIEERLKTNHRLSVRIDGSDPERNGWFGWDSGFGPNTIGKGPNLRLGFLLPAVVVIQEDEGPKTAVELTAEAEFLGSSLASATVNATYVLITSTPTPENIFTAAAVAPTLTYEATTFGTPTPLPPEWVTPYVVTNTPTPGNEATAEYQRAEAIARIIAYGSPTAAPPNLVTATPAPTGTPTPIFIVLNGELPEATPRPTVVNPGPRQTIPQALIGKIAFKSDRSGQERIYVINPDGTGLALLTNSWPYYLAKLADGYSVDGRFQVFTKDALRYKEVRNDLGEVSGVRDDGPALYWYDNLYQEERQLTTFGSGIAYDGVWSPTREQIAFVSNDSNNDEIWVINRDGSGEKQLTRDEWFWWDKHPSWSPDGNYLTFWSNRSGARAIFTMDAGGGYLTGLSRTGYNDWDPVWIKYPDLPESVRQYNGPYDPFGIDRECFDFDDALGAQTFYLTAGGPAADPHSLDPNGNGIACDENGTGSQLD